METFKNLEVIFCADEATWRQWLDKNYTRHEGVWLKIAKKGSGIQSVNHMESLDEALCYGWIDGQGMSYDEMYYLQKYTPRRPRSQWSKINVAKVEALIKSGRMQAPGLAEINAAKADGRWDAAYEPMRNLVVPDDFAVALRRSPKAQAFFDTLNKTQRFAFIYRIMTLKSAERRAARITQYIKLLEENKTLQ
jgi:uncharacterized protein YdeI (YjbR/CyaY-like superfamily)